MPDALLTNPFPGLRSFEYEDRNLFFGREDHIGQIKSKLLQNRFLALVGNSGSGKSSLIKAGLIPSLEQETEGGSAWKVVLFKPGSQPVHSLYTALAGQFGRPAAFDESLNEFTPQQLLDRIDQKLGLAGNQKILVVIDQFEELFRYGYQQTHEPRQNDSSRLLINYLVGQVTSLLPVYIVITMRSDYLDYCTEYDGLTEVINRGNYLLPKMVDSEIYEVITKPAELTGARVSEELTDRLLREVSQSPDRLPILQHALMRSWNRWHATSGKDTPISSNDYEAIGTMQHAITLHAEEIYNQKLDDRRRDAAQKLFKTLITLGPDDSPVIVPTALSDIILITGVPDYLLADVVSVFREEGVSFLTPKPGAKLTPESIVDLTVEKVISLWERSQQWMFEELESAKLYRQLCYSAQLYQEGKSVLWVNPELQLGLNWLKENNPTLNWAQRYNPNFEFAVNFLRFSQLEAEKDATRNEERQKRELKKARIVSVVLGISSLVSLSFFIVAMVLRTQSKQSEKLALEKEALALAEQSRAEEQTREAVSQKKIAEQQGILTELQKQLTEEQKLIAVKEQENALRESAAALAAKVIAEEQRSEAVEARQMAENAQKETESQRKVAVSARQESEQQRERAVSSQREAESARNDALRQRAQAVARFMAIQSAQINASDELAVLLALYAYEFNVKNGGSPENPEVFRALSRVSGTKTARTGHNDIVRTAATIQDPDGSWIASGADDGEVRIWSLTDPTLPPKVLTRQGPNAATGIRAVSFAGNHRLLLAGLADGKIVKWETQEPKPVSKTLEGHVAPIIGLYSFRGNNERRGLVSVDVSGVIKTWDLAGNFALLSTKTLDTKIAGTAISHDRKRLFVCTTSGSLATISPDDPNDTPKQYPLKLGGVVPTALAVTPDNVFLLLGTSRGDLVRVPLTEQAPRETGRVTLKGGHSSAIRKVAVSRDGKRIATASYDWKIRLYNLAEDITRQEPVTLDDFDFWVMDLVFSDDDRTLVATGADKTIRSWDINSEDLFNSLLPKLTRDLTEEEWDKYIGKDIPFERILERKTTGYLPSTRKETPTGNAKQL